MVAEVFIPPSKALDANANPYSGAKWFFYATGTTTPQTVYTTAALSVAHANPVVADSSGKFANIFFDTSLSYRGVLKNSDESVTLHDIDPINSGVASLLGGEDGASLVGFLQSGTGAVAQTMQAKTRNQPVNLEDFGGGVDKTDNENFLALVYAINTKRRLVLNGLYQFDGNYDAGDIADDTGIEVRDVIIEGQGFETGLQFTGTGHAFKLGSTVPASGGYEQSAHWRNFSFLGSGQGAAEGATGVIETASITYQRFTTSALQGFSGTNSTQVGLEGELIGGVFEGVQMAQFGTAFRTKLGYNTVLLCCPIRYNNVGLDITQTVTNLRALECLVERNGIGAAMYLTSDTKLESTFQGNYAGCDIYSFIGNQDAKIECYFENSPRVFVQDGGHGDPAQFMNTGFRFKNCKALKVELIEYADDFSFENCRIGAVTVDQPAASFAVSATQVTDITVKDLSLNADPRTVFTDYTGAGAANLIKRVGVDQTMFRATGAFAPTSGPGMEMIYSESKGQLTAYDRTGLTYLPMKCNGSVFEIAPNGSTVANGRTTGLFVAAGALGYEAGAGGSVTQATNKATGVTLNKATGAITMNNASLSSNTSVKFTLTNSVIGANDTVNVSIKSGATTLAYLVGVEAVAAGSCDIVVRNVSGGSLGEALVLNFTVTKGAVT